MGQHNLEYLFLLRHVGSTGNPRFSFSGFPNPSELCLHITRDRQPLCSPFAFLVFRLTIPRFLLSSSLWAPPPPFPETSLPWSWRLPILTRLSSAAALWRKGPLFLGLSHLSPFQATSCTRQHCPSRHFAFFSLATLSLLHIYHSLLYYIF